MIKILVTGVLILAWVALLIYAISVPYRARRRQRDDDRRAAGALIDPALHHDLIEFVEDLSQTSGDPDELVILPGSLRQRQSELRDRIRSAARRAGTSNI